MGVLGLLPGFYTWPDNGFEVSHEPSLPTTSGHPLWDAMHPPLLDFHSVAARSGGSRRVLSCSFYERKPNAGSKCLFKENQIGKASECMRTQGNCARGTSFADEPAPLPQPLPTPQPGEPPATPTSVPGAPTAQQEEKIKQLEEQVAGLSATAGGSESGAGDPATGEPSAGDPATGEPSAGEGGVNKIMIEKMERRSAKFINLPPGTKKIKDVIVELKAALKPQGKGVMGAPPAARALRPGIETLIQEVGPENLGTSVKNFSASLADLSESVNQNLTKERIAMMTTQDIPNLLHETVARMNVMDSSATALRQKLGSITELANLELARAGDIGRARGKAGAGAVVTDSLESLAGNQHDAAADALATPETVENAETVRLVYEMIDKTVHGDRAPAMAPEIRQEIAQAVITILKKEQAPQAVDPRLAQVYLESGRTQTELARNDPVASLQQQQNMTIPGASPPEIGDSRHGSTSDMVQKILDQIRATQDMNRKAQQDPHMLGFGDVILAAGFAANMSSVLGAVNAASKSAAPGAAMAAERQTPCIRLSPSKQRHTFLSSAGMHSAVARTMQPSARQRRSAAESFF